MYSPSNHPASFNDILWHGFKLSDLTKTVGTLRSDDRDRNENVKKALGFIIKTTTLHMLHGFW